MKSMHAIRPLGGKMLANLGIFSLAAPAVVAGTLISLEEHAWNVLRQEKSFLATIRDTEVAIEQRLWITPDPGDDLDVIVVGDSHAAVLLQGLSERGGELGLKIGATSERKGCLMVAEPYPGRTSQACEEWVEKTLAELEASSSKIVIMHGYTTGRLTGVKRGTGAPLEILRESGEAPADTAEALILYEAGLDNWVSRLTRAGKTIIIVSSVPDFSRPLPNEDRANRTILFAVMSGTSPTVSESDLEQIPLHQAQDRNRPILDVEKRVATRYPEAHVFDLSPLICEESICVQWRDGTLLYSDLDHITSDFSYEVSRHLIENLGPGGTLGIRGP